jgi:acetyl esterase/lipase
MALDPELASFLDVPFPNDLDDLDGTRRELDRRWSEEAASRADPPPKLDSRDLEVPGLADRPPVRVRLYRPVDACAPCGALLFLHGGAFVFGGLESEHARCLRFASMGVAVVSVDYRLAPEHPYPAALDDGRAVLTWLREHATELGVDPGRIAVGGASAGGALAAGLVLQARDLEGPWIRAQLLVYPALDHESREPSIREFDHTEPWDGERTRTMWRFYLAGWTGEVPVYASPARAIDLSRLPPTYIMTAHEDPLRDEALAFARRLLAAGTVVELHHFPRTYHGFDVVAPGSVLAERAMAEQMRFLALEVGRA